MGSEILGNVVPKNAGNRLTDNRHRSKCGESDQRGEQAVLEQILSLVMSKEPANDDKCLLHGGCSGFKKAAHSKVPVAELTGSATVPNLRVSQLTSRCCRRSPKTTWPSAGSRSC